MTYSLNGMPLSVALQRATTPDGLWHAFYVQVPEPVPGTWKTW